MTDDGNTQSIAPTVLALAGADFTDVADAFSNAGFTVRLPAPGILQITSPGQMAPRHALLLSVGIHGDETGPIEMLAHLLTEIAREPRALAVNLMVVVGNLPAIAQGRRFIDADLNRLFCPERRGAQHSAEAVRADVIMRATDNFFGQSVAQRWHLDLHTAIRPSHYPTFAIVPSQVPDPYKRTLIGWLGGAGIGAVVLNALPAQTFSAYTARECNAISTTVELGAVRALGKNDMRLFAGMHAAIRLLLCFDSSEGASVSRPHVFRVAQEIVKGDNDFRLNFDRLTKNFTPLMAGTTIAHDGDTVHRVGASTEYVVFPNPDVRVGQRASLMVVRDDSLAEAADERGACGV